MINRVRAQRRLHFPNFTKGVADPVLEKSLRAYLDNRVVSVTLMSSSRYQCKVKGDVMETRNSSTALNNKWCEATNDIRNKPIPLYSQTNSVSPCHSQSSIHPQPLSNSQLYNPYPLGSKSRSKYHTISQDSKLSQKSMTFSDLSRHTSVEESIAAEETKEFKEYLFFKEFLYQIYFEQITSLVSMSCGTHSACYDCTSEL